MMYYINLNWIYQIKGLVKIEKIYLIDKKPELCAIWSQAFDLYPEVVIIEGDYFQQEADAIVSPANSFGIMDGGLDLAIRNEIGFKVEDDLQSEIIKHYHGELPIGSAIIVPTNHSKWSYLISAPTMRIPENVEYTFNAYYAFRAILLAVNAYNRSDSNPIRTLVCCGLGPNNTSIFPEALFLSKIREFISSTTSLLLILQELAIYFILL